MPPSPPGVRRREEYSDKRGKGSLVDELANAPDLELKCRHHGGNKGAGSRSGQGPEEKTRSWLEEAGWQQPGSLTLAAAQAAFAISSSPQYRLCVCRSGGFHVRRRPLPRCTLSIRKADGFASGTAGRKRT